MLIYFISYDYFLITHNFPSITPTSVPSKAPSLVPSTSPSTVPSKAPSSVPSASPSTALSKAPSSVPSTSPSTIPSYSPSLVTAQDIIATIAGSSTSGGYSGDNVQATSATLYYPQGVAMDTSGRITITISQLHRCIAFCDLVISLECHKFIFPHPI